MRALNYRNLREQYDADPQNCVRELNDAIVTKAVSMENFSIRELAEAFLGEQIVRAMEPGRKSGGLRLLEAGSAVDTTAFSNITGQIIFSTVKEQFKLAAMLAESLCTTTDTTFLNGEKIPGIGGIGDEAEIVDEAQPYPYVGVNEEYVETPALKKRGFIVPVTREIIVADRTGVLMQQVSQTAQWLGLNKEKRVLDTVVGVTNTYKRNGTSLNTYLTSGAYVNSHSNTLVDWTDIENAELLFDAMTDPNTGEPIGANMLGMAMTLIAPTKLRRTADRIVKATDIRYGDGASSTTATYGPNPLTGTPITVVSSPYVKQRTSSDSKWFFGDPKKAFAYMQAWGIETSQAPTNSEAEFERDIKMQFKVSEMGTAAVVEPRYMTENT